MPSTHLYNHAINRDTGLLEHRLDIYRPRESSGPLPIVLYIHGGGFRILSKDTHWVMGLAFARREFLVFNQELATLLKAGMPLVQSLDILRMRMSNPLFKSVLDTDIETPFPRLSYREAMDRFGNDKPDLRFGLELKDMADLASKGTFKVFLDALASGGSVKAINGKGMAGLSRKEIDTLTAEAPPCPTPCSATHRFRGTGNPGPGS